MSHKLQILKTIIDIFPSIEDKTKKSNDNLSITNNIFRNLLKKYNNKTEEESYYILSKNLRKKKIYTDCKLNIERLL